MLEMMKRSHSRSETETILNKLRKGIPGACIRTTLIVGHPVETVEEFRELKEFVKEFRFDRLGAFKYSHEDGTFSFTNYTDDIPDDIKESRLAEIMELQQTISAENNEKHVGQVLKVIIDGREGNFYTGRTEYDSPEVDQEVLVPVEYDLKPGSFYQIEITKSTDFDLFGKPV
jgi:ribosomal protein S12 methylthiotransferase